MKKIFKKIRSWFKRDLIRCVGDYNEYYDAWEVVYGYDVEECREKIRLGLFEYETNLGIDFGLMSDEDCNTRYHCTIVEDAEGRYKTIEEMLAERENQDNEI